MAYEDTGFYKFLQSPGTMPMALSLLAAGGPSRTPTSMGQSMARGLGAYQQGVLADQQRTLAAEAAKRKGLLETAQIGKIQAETARLGLPAKRETVTQGGIAYYQDTGEKVLPEVEGPPKMGALPKGTYLNKEGNVEFLPGAEKAIEAAAKKKDYKKVYDLFVDAKGKPHYIEEGEEVPGDYQLASTFAPSAITDDQIKWGAAQFNLTGKMPSFGRGKASSMIRQKLFAEATRQNIEKGITPGDIQSIQSLNKSLSGSLSQQEKQIGSMGSFVKNLNKQIARVSERADKLKMADARILNVPLRKARQMIIGDPNQAILEMYLTEISMETGKLSTGSTASVAELSQGAQEKWQEIHDPNMPIQSLLALLKETSHAGNMRMDSVREARDETLGRIRGLSDYGAPQEILEQVQLRPPAGTTIDTTMGRMDVEGEAPPALSPGAQDLLKDYGY